MLQGLGMLCRQANVSMLQVSPGIMADVENRTFSLVVQGNTIAVGSVGQRNAVIVNNTVIVIPSNNTVITNTTLYIGLGVGLGAGLILILVIAVILGVVGYIYRR